MGIPSSGSCRCRTNAASGPYYAPVTSTEDDPREADPGTPKGGRSAIGIRQGFLVSKQLILRGLGAVYFCAFLSAFNQNRALLGAHGLAPAERHFARLQQQSGQTPLDGFLSHPAIWWWLPITDDRMDALAAAGMGLSALLLLGTFSSALLLSLWLLYFSIVTIAEGSSFYAYGWESQLLETGFLGIFLCELRPWCLRRDAPPSPIVLWLFRWLIFRISLGAGLIKLRGSSCWTAKTCLHYHFETQPIPSPTSFAFHFLPKPVLSSAVDLDLLVQIYTVWLVLVPGIGPLRYLRRAGGWLQALFMVNIALSGNLAILNHLTILPALACLDDLCWPRALRPKMTGGGQGARSYKPYGGWVRLVVDGILLVTIAGLSWPVIANLLQLDGRQVMNGSFDNFRLVNTYGAFGSVGEARYEAVISVSWGEEEAHSPGPTRSHEQHVSPSTAWVWSELDLPCKPGNVTRRPCFSAPYHYRLDWNIWFLGFKPHAAMLQQREQWLFAFLAKILAADPLALSLLDGSGRTLISERGRPRIAKVDMWHYRMAAPLWEIALRAWRREEVIWWERRREEGLVPPVRLQPGTERLVEA